MSIKQFKIEFDEAVQTWSYNCLIGGRRVTYQDLESKFWLAKKTITPPYWNSISRSDQQTLSFSPSWRGWKKCLHSRLYAGWPNYGRFCLSGEDNHYDLTKKHTNLRFRAKPAIYGKVYKVTPPKTYRNHFLHFFITAFLSSCQISISFRLRRHFPITKYFDLRFIFVVWVF